MTYMSKKTGKKPSLRPLKERWSCSQGCKTGNRPCEHLEKELYKVYAKNSVRARPGGEAIDRTASLDFKTNEELLHMYTKLGDYALPEIYRLVLVSRFVLNWSFASIADFFNIPSKQTAFNIYKRGVALLKERKYGVDSDG